MCTISIDVDEKVLRQANPNLDNIVTIRQWAQRLVDLSTKEMLGEDTETMDIEAARAMVHEAIREEYAMP